MIQYRRRKSKLHEAATRRSRVRRLNEWDEKHDPGFCQEYSGVLEGCDILHIDGNDYIDDLVKDKDWWDELCEINRWKYNLNLDRDGNEPGDEDYDPDFPMYNENDIYRVKYQEALSLLEDDIMQIDNYVHDEKVRNIIYKHLEHSEYLIHGAFTDHWFYLYKNYGDNRGNQVEWVFNEDVLEDNLESIADTICNGDLNLAKKKVIACCKEINQYVRDNSFAELSDYVRY